MRRVDDNIPHALNTINTDDPAACAHLFRTLTATYADRDALVRKCMSFFELEVQAVRRKLDASPAEEFDLRSHLYAEEAKVGRSASNCWCAKCEHLYDTFYVSIVPAQSSQEGVDRGGNHSRAYSQGLSHAMPHVRRELIMKHVLTAEVEVRWSSRDNNYFT